MVNRLPQPQRPSVGHLAEGILDDVHDLFQQNLQLLREDLREDLANAKVGASFLTGGVVMAAVGVVLLGFSLAYLLNLAGLPLWAAFLIVSACWIAGGVALVFAGMSHLKEVDPVPEVKEVVQENLEWETTPGRK